VLLLSKSSSKFVRNDDGDDDFDADSDCRLIRGGKTTNPDSIPMRLLRRRRLLATFWT
jgi:hypothetical protein